MPITLMISSILLLADAAAHLVRARASDVALDEGGVAHVGVGAVGGGLHDGRRVAGAGEQASARSETLPRYWEMFAQPLITGVVVLAHHAVHQRLRGLAGVDVHRVDLVDLVLQLGQQLVDVGRDRLQRQLKA